MMELKGLITLMKPNIAMYIRHSKGKNTRLMKSWLRMHRMCVLFGMGWGTHSHEW